MTVQLAPLAVQRFYDNSGALAVGGKLYTYAAGTSTPQATYTDSTGGTANTNPIVLNARGEASIWLTSGQSYKLVLTDALNNTLWTSDNVTGADAAAVQLRSDLAASSGSSLVGFIQAGAGAVARTQQDKDRDLVNAKDYGATGGGVSDDTAYIQSLLTVNPGRLVTIGPGTFNVSAQITGANGQTVVLEDGCIIKATAAMRSVFVWQDKANVTVKGEGTIDCNNLAQTGVLFNSAASGCVDCTAKEITVKNTATDATLQYGGVEASSSGGAAGGIRGTRINILGCKFFNVGTHGAIAAYCDVVNYCGNTVDTAANHGFEAVSCTDVLESYNIIRNCTLSGLGVGTHTTHWAIKNNIIRNCGGDGSITCEHNSINGSISDNEVYDANTQGINISYGTSGGTVAPYDTIRNISARNNTLIAKSTNTTHVGINCYAIPATPGVGIVLDSNTISGFNKGITGAYLKGASVCDNTVPALSGTNSSVVEMTLCTGGAVEDNECSYITGTDAYSFFSYGGSDCDYISFKNNYAFQCGAAGAKAMLHIDGAGHFPIGGNITQSATNYVSCAGSATIQLTENFGPLLGTPIGGAGTPTVLNSVGNYNGSQDFSIIGSLSIRAGAGAPAYTAPKGSIYMRTDGSSTSTRVYVNTDGAATWTNITTAA